MLRYTEFDLKTGQVLTDRDFEGNEVAREKRVEHSYLEHWLQVNNLPDANLWMAKFYEGVNNSDRIENEAQGRVLVFSNARKGYFADPDTARVMIHGDEAAGIRSIYADDRSSPHNLAAYGSLLAAGGIASSTQGQARILVIDNEHWSHGDQPLIDRFGQTVPPEELVKLYRKMGDGTMLTSSQIMLDLITEKERDRITADVFKRAGIDTKISGLTTLEPEVEAASQRIEQQLMQLAQRKVTQFRAGSPDLPGLIKGTMATSQWCGRLNVDLIVSVDDIKGADRTLLEPGIKLASNLFVNRMTDAAYGYQMIGPQVKACIPEATLHEFNPKLEQRAKQLHEIASDPKRLLACYVAKQERCIDNLDEEADEASPRPSLEADWLYQIAKADEYGVIEESGKVNTTLERFLRTERIDTATKGIEVESATAQAHGLLKPWEVCNKDLEHGTLLFYMRSPFPNIGAAAIAINNLEAIRQEDREAFGKDGVIYLPICQYGDAENPKHKLLHVPITDCDGDRNGCFRGYRPTVSDLPEQIRAELSHVESQSPLVQYEAARALFGEMVSQIKSGQEGRIEPDVYPMAVAEAIERTAPEVKPLEIYKQAKVKHPWNEGESHSAALWRAWEVTANNPTGICANIGMKLQALALETHYISDDKKEALLRQISAHYQKLLNKFDDGNLVIPSDEDLASKNLPPYRLLERIAEVSRANIKLMRITESEQRKSFVQAQIEAVGSLLMDLANGPAAMNLQTAVDNLKSSVGIDVKINELLEKIAHKENKIQSSKIDPGVYLSGKQMETSTEEPISWGVRIANQFYRDSKLPERPHLEFSYIMPRDFMASESGEIEHIGRSYNAAIKQINSDDEKAKQDGRIHLLVCTTVADKQIKIFCDDLKIYDECNADFWWKLGNPRDVQIRLEQEADKYGKSNEIIAYFQLKQSDKKSEFSPPRRIGAVSKLTQDYSDLLEKVKAAPIVISLPQLRLMSPKIIDKSSTEDLRKDARRLRDDAIAQLPEMRRYNYACAAWHDVSTMKLALQYFVPELAAAVQNLPKIRVQGLELQGNETGKLPDGEYTIRVQELSYQRKTGETIKARAIAVVIDDEPKTLGTIYSRSIRLPIGTMAQAHISSNGNYADIELRGRLRELEPIFNSRENPPALTEEMPASQPPSADQSTAVSQPSTALHEQDDTWKARGAISNACVKNWAMLQLYANTEMNMPRIPYLIEQIWADDRVPVAEGSMPSLEQLLAAQQMVSSGQYPSDPEHSSRQYAAANSASDQSAAAQISQSLTIATDGACSGNPGSGGWSAILVQGESYQELGGAVEEATNNRMEMLAVIEALKVVKASERFNDQTPITIISDSQLVIKGATSEWKRNANLDLWAEYDRAASGLELQFEWIKGHSGHELNERADVIAGAFAQGKLPELRDSSGGWVNDHSQPIQHATPTSEPSQDSAVLAADSQNGGKVKILAVIGEPIQPSVEPVHPVGKHVQMVFPLKLHGDTNPLPVDSCIEAMRGYGRCHTTRTFEPYAAYGFQSGDIAIAYAGEKQVAFRVGEQYRITPEMIADPIYRQQWAKMEKHSHQELLYFQTKPAVWGLKMEPLGDYVNGKIQPFPIVEPQPQHPPALLPQGQDLHIIASPQILYLESITRDFVRSHPEAVFLFGDNMAGTGLGGQAGAIWGESNVIGIPTKHSPTSQPNAFFSDSDLAAVQPVLEQRFKQIDQALESGKTLYVLAAGVGTSLSQLPEKSPQIYSYVQQQLAERGINPPDAPSHQSYECQGTAAESGSSLLAQLAQVKNYPVYLIQAGTQVELHHNFDSYRDKVRSDPACKQAKVWSEAEALDLVERWKNPVPVATAPTATSESPGSAAPDAAEIASSIQVVSQLPDDVINSLRQRLEELKPQMRSDPSNYATGRQSAWIGVEWDLRNKSFKSSGVWDEKLWAFCQRISPGAQMALITYSGNETKGRGIGLHRDDSYANFSARSLTIESSNDKAGNWQMQQTYPGMEYNSIQNINAPVHQFSIPSGTVINFNCKNPHAAEPNPDRWSINLWTISPKYEAAYSAHVEKHGLSGGAASQLSSDSMLILPRSLSLKPADLTRLAAPNIVAVTELSAFSPQRSTPKTQAASPAPSAQIAKPVNIYSGSPDGLGAALTNPTELSHHKGRIADHYPVTFQGERWPDAEAAYQHHKSSTQTGSERETLMSAILQAKLEQYPKLTVAIEKRGGSEWIQSCEHTVNRSGGSYWEGKGQESAFLRCLSNAYSNVKAAAHSENGKRSGDRLTSTSASDSSYSPTRGELLHWMEIAKIAEQGERQMQIRTLGLELKRQYLQQAGDGAAEIPRDYRHPSVTISTEDRQHFTNQISIIRNALQQMYNNAKLDALPSACER